MLSFGPGHILAATVRSTLGFEHPSVSKVGQGVEIVAGTQIDAPTIAAIATVRAAFGDIFFSTETEAAIATVAGLYRYAGFVNKFHDKSIALSVVGWICEAWPSLAYFTMRDCEHDYE